MMFVFGPLLVIGKIIQVLLPYSILGYLAHNNLIFSGKIDAFQMVMLWVYIGLQLIVLILGWKVLTIHKYLYHIDVLFPKRRWQSFVPYSAGEWYESIAWYPEVKAIVYRVYGSDIGPIIMDYCHSID